MNYKICIICGKKFAYGRGQRSSNAITCSHKCSTQNYYNSVKGNNLRRDNEKKPKDI